MAANNIERVEAKPLKVCEIEDKGVRAEVATLLASPEGRGAQNSRVFGPCAPNTVGNLTLIGDDDKPIHTDKPLQLKFDAGGNPHAAPGYAPKASDGPRGVVPRPGAERPPGADVPPATERPSSPEAGKPPEKADHQGIIMDAKGKFIAAIGADGKLHHEDGTVITPQEAQKLFPNGLTDEHGKPLHMNPDGTLVNDKSHAIKLRDGRIVEAPDKPIRPRRSSKSGPSGKRGRRRGRRRRGRRRRSRVRARGRRHGKRGRRGRHHGRRHRRVRRLH